MRSLLREFRPALLACVAIASASLSQGANAALRAELDASDHRLTFYDGDRVARVFKVRLGLGGIGKCRAGDKRTPLGTYGLSPARKSAEFRWFLPVSYPNAQDRANGCNGGDIGLHGTGKRLHRKFAHSTGMDWTLGCMAVSNEDIDRIRELVRSPIQLTIRR